MRATLKNNSKSELVIVIVIAMQSNTLCQINMSSRIHQR